MLNRIDIEGMIPVVFCERIADDQDLKLKIADNMKTYGGDFVKALGVCLLRADHYNIRKLAIAFYPLFTEYATWGEDEDLIIRRRQAKYIGEKVGSLS